MMPSIPIVGAKLRMFAVVGLSLGASVAASAVSAQTPPPGSPATPPEVMEPPTESPVPRSDPKEPLSKELKEGEGVIEPPRGIDPGIKKPIPDEFESKTPVIPPPGEPGGQQDLQPK